MTPPREYLAHPLIVEPVRCLCNEGERKRARGADREGEGAREYEAEAHFF